MAIIIGWVSNLFFIYGVYALGKKNINGFYSTIVANVLYIIQSIMLNNSAFLWLSIALVILNTKGIFEWSKSPQKENLNKQVLDHAEHSYFVEAMRHYDGRI